MRLMDDKGRIFGAINLLDLLVIALILSVSVSIFSNNLLCCKVSHKSLEMLTVNVVYRDIPDEIMHNRSILKEGDKDLLTGAVLSGIGDLSPSKSGRGNDVVLVLKGRCAVLNGEYYLGNSQIKVGLPFTFSPPGYAFAGGSIISFSAEGNKDAPKK